MGQICMKRAREMDCLDSERNEVSQYGLSFKIDEKCCLKQSVQYMQGRQEQNIKLMQPDLYQELQQQIEKYQNSNKESLQIVMNVKLLNQSKIFLYCNFKDDDVKRCFNLLKTNSDYKEELKLIGIYRESSLKYHKKEFCSLCSQENMECYSLRCQHIFCKDCWHQMIDIQLSDSIPIVKCLEYQCLERLPHQFLELNQLYKEILVKRMLDNDSNYTWCPGLNCQNIYKLEGLALNFKCHCGVRFCSKCKVDTHYPIPCETLKEITQYKESNQSWTVLDISVCPFCSRNIQRIQGCIQMSCVCGNDFCNKCSQPWNKEHGQDYVNCSFASYNKNPSQILNQMRQNESALTKDIFQLENYQQQLNKQNQDYQRHRLQMSLRNLIKFKKFQKMQQFIKLLSVLYFTYYLNEKFNDNSLDQYYDKFQLEINNYQRNLLNQLQGVLFNEQEVKNNDKINFNEFVNLVYQMDQKLKVQRHCFKKQIIELLQEKQQQIQ
ncbi:unnamed protein product (macronuclear) [Paramecium tetraurelia]|uniref:RBR-type E3 ubiquitin transferase n=1 Tax=Paramecium tetraurelia TaxID=5888 RepID=A0C0J8_PARTE|nr:uncharacterized protein GSPATT00006168001 [Paramecium tetraurelia]CAK64315.1 unnamed protein product [Paramecium tetraurelia]|eukprot:XP_001431713.1 hypothetical protein (macronuclear) [Paramecium tetraurelia strain d4-2]